MNRSLVISLTAVLLSFDLWGVKASWGSNNDFNDHWLAAACTQVPRGGRLKGKVFQTEYGPAVGHEGGSAGRLVLYCNVDPDLYHNWIQIFALDNTPSGYVKATLFQQGVNSAQAPTEIASVTTSDQSGIQKATFFIDPPIEPDELNFMYYIEIVIYRQNPDDKVLAFSASLMDVL